MGGVPPAPHRCQFPVPVVGPLCPAALPALRPGCVLRDSGAERCSSRNVFCPAAAGHDVQRRGCSWAAHAGPAQPGVRGGDVGQFGREDGRRDWWPHRRSGSLRSYHAVPDLDSALTRPRSLEDARVHIPQDQAEMEGGWASGLDEERKVYQIVRKNTQTTCLFGDRRQRADGAGAYTRVRRPIWTEL